MVNSKSNMSLEGLTRVLSALAGAPPGEDSLKRKHVTRSVETSPRPDAEIVTTQPKSPQSQSSLGPRKPSDTDYPISSNTPAFSPVPGRTFPSHLATPTEGIVSANHLVEQFRTCMSTLLDGKMTTILKAIENNCSQISDLKLSVEARLATLETRIDTVEKSHHDTVRELEESVAFLSAKYDETEITRQAATNSNDQQNAAIRSLANRVDNVVKDVDQAMFQLSTNMDSLKQSTSGSAAASEDIKKTCQDLHRRVQILKTPNRTPCEACPVVPPAQNQPPLPVPQLCNTVREIVQEDRRQIEIRDNAIISGLPEVDNENLPQLIRTLVPEINPATIEVKRIGKPSGDKPRLIHVKTNADTNGAPHEKSFWPEAWCT